MADYGEELVHVLIRCDASVSIGTGHVMRCIALAQALKKLDMTITFLSQSLSKSLKERMVKEGFSLVELTQCAQGDDLDIEQTKTFCQTNNPQILILDGYNFDLEYQMQLNALPSKMLLIDDSDGSRKICADFILNQNIWATTNLYQLSAFESNLLLGPRFALFRQEFCHRIKSRQISPTVQNILVTPGGSDPSNIIPTVVEALKNLNSQQLKIRLLLGSMNQRKEEIKAATKHFPCQLELFDHIDSMPNFMEWADLAISGGGFTTFELALMGTPSLFFIESKYQEPNVNEFEKKQLARSLGHSKNCTASSISKAINEIMTDHAIRTHFSTSCKLLFDGEGASRVAQTLLQ